MREKMKKMLFLMLFLLILGAANVNSQVRIGGNGQPNTAAVLDLNATDATINGTKGLALPRVSLSSNTVQITSGTANLSGMLVYNTNATLGAGVYYWNGTNWLKITNSPVGTADIADGAVTSSKIAVDAIDSTKIKNGGISLRDLAPGPVDGQSHTMVFSDGAWSPKRLWRFGASVHSLDSLKDKPVGWVGPIIWSPGHIQGLARHCWSNVALTPDFEWWLRSDTSIFVIKHYDAWTSNNVLSATTTCMYW
ncbi:hypothetical protein FACS189451_02670 [Bacteroidia bacterium]|nr:hypothetical protein FACS189446_4490 [Bacteroidia bacterium]GHT61175.1 hypothetical protein FACS189451_02670 [Bacteroidia bacterium]